MLKNIVEIITQFTSMGAPVHPLKPRSKSPDTPHGYKDATLDGSIYLAHWQRDDNLGVATGHGLDAIDMDGPKAIMGFASAFAGELGARPPETLDEAFVLLMRIGPVVLTGKGAHVYCLPDATRSCSAKLLEFGTEGVDYRGLGGYVVAPPSIHESGRAYRFLTDLHKPLMKAPECLPRSKAKAYSFEAPKTAAVPLSSQGSTEHPDSYFSRVLEANCGRISDHQESGWHDQILASAQKVGQVLDGSQERADRAFTSLMQAAAPRTRADAKNAAQTIRDGLSWGSDNPHILPPQPTPARARKASQPAEDLEDEELQQKKKMNAAEQTAEVVRLLEEDPELTGILAYDTWSDRIKKMRPLEGDPEARARSSYWEDCDSIRLQKIINDRFAYNIGDKAFEKAITIVAHDNSFDPVRDYLMGCERGWDGRSRVAAVLEALGAQCNKPQKLSMAYWLAGACARGIAADDVKFDSLIVLESKQGFGKSSFIKILGGEYAGDSAIDLDHPREAYQQLSAAWIHELAELASVLRSSPEAVKAFITKTADDYRKPYAHQITHKIRRCVFAGTTNEDDYLRDETGNRRFWPIACGETREQLDFAWLSENRDQIWGEGMALMRYYMRRPHGISPDAAEAKMFADYATTRQQADELRDAICDFVREKFAHATGLEVDVTPDDVLEDRAIPPLMENYKGSKRNLVRKILVQLGGKPCRVDIAPPAAGYDFSSEADRRRQLRVIRFVQPPSYRGAYDDSCYAEVVLPTENT